jgi:hypothetical protein
VYFNPKFNSLIYLLYDYMTKRRQLYDQGETYIYLCVAIQNKSSVVEHYMYVVGKCIIYLYKISKPLEKRTFGKFFNPVSQRVQMNFIFSDNVHILCFVLFEQASCIDWIHFCYIRSLTNM